MAALGGARRFRPGRWPAPAARARTRRLRQGAARRLTAACSGSPGLKTARVLQALSPEREPLHSWLFLQLGEQPAPDALVWSDTCIFWPSMRGASPPRCCHSSQASCPGCPAPNTARGPQVCGRFHNLCHFRTVERVSFQLSRLCRWQCVRESLPTALCRYHLLPVLAHCTALSTCCFVDLLLTASCWQL